MLAGRLDMLHLEKCEWEIKAYKARILQTHVCERDRQFKYDSMLAVMYSEDIELTRIERDGGQSICDAPRVVQTTG